MPWPSTDAQALYACVNITIWPFVLARLDSSIHVSPTALPRTHHHKIRHQNQILVWKCQWWFPAHMSLIASTNLFLSPLAKTWSWSIFLSATSAKSSKCLMIEVLEVAEVVKADCSEEDGWLETKVIGMRLRIALAASSLRREIISLILRGTSNHCGRVIIGTWRGWAKMMTYIHISKTLSFHNTFRTSSYFHFQSASMPIMNLVVQISSLTTHLHLFLPPSLSKKELTLT